MYSWHAHSLGNNEVAGATDGSAVCVSTNRGFDTALDDDTEIIIIFFPRSAKLLYQERQTEGEQDVRQCLQTQMGRVEKGKELDFRKIAAKNCCLERSQQRTGV